MIELKDLYALLAENEQKIADLQAENRVINKLVVMENEKNQSTIVEQVEESQQEVEEEITQQDESY